MGAVVLFGELSASSTGSVLTIRLSRLGLDSADPGSEGNRHFERQSLTKTPCFSLCCSDSTFQIGLWLLDRTLACIFLSFRSDSEGRPLSGDNRLRVCSQSAPQRGVPRQNDRTNQRISPCDRTCLALLLCSTVAFAFQAQRFFERHFSGICSYFSQFTQ